MTHFGIILAYFLRCAMWALVSIRFGVWGCLWGSTSTDKRVASDSSTQLIPRPRRPPMVIEMALFFSARLTQLVKTITATAVISDYDMRMIIWHIYEYIYIWHIWHITRTISIYKNLEATCHIDSNQTSTLQRCPPDVQFRPGDRTSRVCLHPTGLSNGGTLVSGIPSKYGEDMNYDSCW